MGLKTNKNERIPVGRFCGKHAMGAKKTENFHFIFYFYSCVFFVATYGNEVISVGKKHRPAELFTPFEALYKTCL